MQFYRLVNNIPVQEEDSSKFSKTYFNEARILHQFESGDFDCHGFVVDTRFLCVPRGERNGTPILFETTVLSRSPLLFMVERCAFTATTYDEALFNHKDTIKLVNHLLANAGVDL